MNIVVSRSLLHLGDSRNRPGGLVVSLNAEDSRVMLHRDLFHEIPTVAAILTEGLATIEADHATHIATEAATVRQAVVIVCAKALAKRYRDQLTRQYRLIVSLQAV